MKFWKLCLSFEEFILYKIPEKFRTFLIRVVIFFLIFFRKVDLSVKKLIKLFLLFLYKINFFTFLFYLKAFFFFKKAKTTKEIYEKFYLDFLGIKKEECKIVKITRKELRTRCYNKCPILQLAIYIEKDTREVCKKISEPVCIFVLKKMNKKIKFFRNYRKIRPYANYCEELITI